jgi:hypothetical protein
MTRLETLRQLYSDSLLSEVFLVKKEEDFEDHSNLRFVTNEFRIRSIEIWEHADGQYFRIYYSPEAPDVIKSEIAELPGRFKSKKDCTDFRGNFPDVAKGLRRILNSEAAQTAAQLNPIVARGFGYEGLVLPDVDPSDDEVLGRTFTWKEIIAIEQDSSDDNPLKKALSQCGTYLQRSVDGKSRYVGSAYSEGGILARWMHHLKSNGHAKHLNFFILENGYSHVLFTVLEITAAEQARNSEARWKATLGTGNDGPYDGFRLNCN